MNNSSIPNDSPKILLLDIETAPNTAHVWGLWKQNVGLNQLLESSYTMCFAAKWYGATQTDWYGSRYGVKKMLNAAHRLLDKADFVVHYNGTQFDIPTLNKEFLLHRMPPPSPFKQVDLLKVARRQFRFPSNRLDYVADALGLGKKTHVTHELWIKCMNGDEKAWGELAAYNMRDVHLLENVYEFFLPWIKNHPNNNNYVKEGMGCPNCGSENYQKRGFAYTAMLKYQRYQCGNCGNWFRSSKTISLRGKETFLNVKGT